MEGEFCLCFRRTQHSTNGSTGTLFREKIQVAITEAVKKADLNCAAFVERTTRTSVLEANWAVMGIKFGRSDRNKAGDAVKGSATLPLCSVPRPRNDVNADGIDRHGAVHSVMEDRSSSPTRWIVTVVAQ
jgi:hypothetical protein